MRPGINVKIGNDQVPGRSPGSSGRAFIAALAAKGPLDTPIEVRSIYEAVLAFGERIAESPLYDVLDVAFRRGLDHAIVARSAGDAAAVAKKALKAGETNVLEVLATSPGEWANSVEAEVVDGVTPGTIHLKVLLGEVVTETSPELADNDAAVAWAATYSKLIRLKKLAATKPAVQKVKLAGGVSDNGSVDATVIGTTLEAFGPDYGTGQVYAPGFTDEETQTAVLAHCAARLRTPILDGLDTADADELIEQVGALRSVDGHKHAAVFVPWDVVPGLSIGTTRTVPPGARQIGAIAAVDRASGTSNLPAAGDEGKDSYAVGLSQTYSNEDIERLTAAGINVSVIDDNEVTTMGWRTLADPVTEEVWLSLASSRQVLAMAAEVRTVLKRYLFKPLDSQGITRNGAEGACKAEVIKPAYQAGAIFGATEGEAGQVTVEQNVDPGDASIGKLTGRMAVRPTEFSEVIEFEVVASSRAL
jgi:hypothetical protein